jgi:prepilin-type N-terminal cleavage/methylation domain-containing protein
MFNSKGFTLIELLVVLIIISISSATIFLSVSSGSFFNKEKIFINNVSRLIKKARLYAIVKGTKSKVCIIPDEKIFAFNNKKITVPENITVRQEKLVTQNDKYCIIFLPNGSSSGGNLYFYWDTGKTGLQINKFLGLIDVIPNDEL